ncbi:MAG: hypothetical protein EOO41_04860, partial [Methanobacteriota archaeon]
LLFAGRKFDIRLWVLVTDTWDIYMYADGYCRTSSEQFRPSVGKRSGAAAGAAAAAGTAQMVHLTNYCMQKHSKNLGAFEEGNTLSFEQLQTYLDATYGAGYISIRQQLMPRWKEATLDAFLGARDALVVGAKSRRYFELWGLDFMIDEVSARTRVREHMHVQAHTCTLPCTCAHRANSYTRRVLGVVSDRRVAEFSKLAD